MATNSSFLDPLLSPTLADHGTEMPRRRELNFLGTGVTLADDLANDSTDVTITAGGSSVPVAVADVAALRVAALVDKQIYFTLSQPGAWVYSSSTGAGLVDDGFKVVKPTAVLIGNNGRFYSTAPDSSFQFLSSSNISAMQARIVSNLADGVHCWVQSVKRAYILDTNGLTPSADLDTYSSATAGRIWMGPQP